MIFEILGSVYTFYIFPTFAIKIATIGRNILVQNRSHDTETWIKTKVMRFDMVLRLELLWCVIVKFYFDHMSL